MGSTLELEGDVQDYEDEEQGIPGTSQCILTLKSIGGRFCAAAVPAQIDSSLPASSVLVFHAHVCVCFHGTKSVSAIWSINSFPVRHQNNAPDWAMQYVST